MVSAGIVVVICLWFYGNGLCLWFRVMVMDTVMVRMVVRVNTHQTPMAFVGSSRLR